MTIEPDDLNRDPQNPLASIRPKTPAERGFMGIPVLEDKYIPKGIWLLIEEGEIKAFGKHMNQSIRIDALEKALTALVGMVEENGPDYANADQMQQVRTVLKEPSDG